MLEKTGKPLNIYREKMLKKCRSAFSGAKRLKLP